METEITIEDVYEVAAEIFMEQWIASWPPLPNDPADYVLVDREKLIP